MALAGEKLVRDFRTGPLPKTQDDCKVPGSIQILRRGRHSHGVPSLRRIHDQGAGLNCGGLRIYTKTLRSLADVFSQIPDLRCKRGVRHPFPGMLALKVFLGLLARIRELARLQDWAARHWAELQELLGFDSPRPPHATTLSLALVRFTLADFHQAFARWLVSVVQDPQELSVAAVDAKTACQSHEDGRPVQILSIFAHLRQTGAGAVGRAG